MTWRWAIPALTRIAAIYTAITHTEAAPDAAEDGAPWLHLETPGSVCRHVLVTPELGRPGLFGLVSTSHDEMHVKITGSLNEAEVVAAVVRCLTL